MAGGFRVSLVGLSLLALAVVSARAHGEHAVEGIPGPAKPGVPTPASGTPTVTLPVAIVTEPLPRNAYPVFITPTELFVGAPARSLLVLPGAEERSRSGVGAAYKTSAQDGYVKPLGLALAARRCGVDGKVPPVTVVYADAAVEYRVLMDVLYSLSLLGYSELYLATRSSTAQTQPASAATRGVRVRAKPSATHIVEVRADGLALRNQGGSAFGRDCSELPTSAAAPPLSLDTVRTCAGKLLGTSGNLHLVAAGATPVQAILPALETLGQGRSVTPTFPSSAGLAARDGATDAASSAAPSGTVSNAAKVVGSLRSGFRACYQQELETAPDRAGKVRLTLRVDAQGNVRDVTLAPEGNLGSTLACVKALAQAAKFAPPEGGNAVIAVPVTFVKEEQKELRGQKPPCTP
jgi:hypothetical protein